MRSRLSVCCGNCDWYREFLDEKVCANPEQAEVMQKKKVDEWCDKYQERKIESEQRTETHDWRPVPDAELIFERKNPYDGI